MNHKEQEQLKAILHKVQQKGNEDETSLEALLKDTGELLMPLLKEGQGS